MKILSLPNINMLFQLVLTKFFKSELFLCLPKVDHVIKSCKEPVWQREVVSCQDFILCSVATFWVMSLVGIYVDHVITVMQRAYCDSDGKAKNK